MFDKDDDAMLSFNEIISLIRCMAEIEEEFDAQKLESGLRPETVSQFRRALTKAAFGRTKATMLASKKHSLSELISLSVNHALQSKQDRRRAAATVGGAREGQLPPVRASSGRGCQPAD